MVVQKLTAREVARKLGLTEGAISLAAKRGRIVKSKDGLIDPRHPVNELYLKGSSRQRRQSSGKPGEKAKHREPRAPPHPGIHGDSGGDGAGGGSLQEERAQQEVRKLKAQADSTELNNAIKRGQFISRDLMHAFLSRLYVVDTAELRPLGDRVSSTLVGIVRSNEADEVAATRVNQKITEEVFRSLEHIKTLLHEFIAKGAVETEEDEVNDDAAK